METYTVKKYKDRTEWYNSSNQLHRTDGPAVECADGGKFWYQNGLYHRTDGPAVEYANGDKEWWIDGKVHRTDGPAIEWANGYKGWWINDVDYTEEEFNKKISEMNDPCNGKSIEVDGKTYELKLIK